MKLSTSFKLDTRKTNIDHNNRTMSDKEKEKNSHIDYSRSHKNRYLVQENIRDVYEREFGESLKKYNDKQKRKDRKIKDYYKHIQKGKKTRPQQELIIQIGDKEDFEKNIGYREGAVEILEEWFEGFQERNPNLKVYNCVIHDDEASPHMHLNFVPVATGYKRGLEKQVSFNKAVASQDIEFNQVRPFEDWRNKEVDLLVELLRERGVERKLVGTNEYEDVNEYKEKQQELAALEQKLKETKLSFQTELKKLDVISEKEKEEKEGLQPIVVDLDDEPIPEVKVKKTLVGNNYTVDPEELKKLQEYAVSQKDKNEKLKKDMSNQSKTLNNLHTIVEYQNDHVDDLVNDRMSAERQKRSLERLESNRLIESMEIDSEALRNENKALRGEIKVLRQWKERAIKFMQNTKVFERFETWLKKLNKNRNHDFER